MSEISEEAPKKNLGGRPPKPSTPLYVKLDNNVAALLPGLIKATGTPKTRVIEDAIRELAKKHKVKPQLADSSPMP